MPEYKAPEQLNDSESESSGDEADTSTVEVQDPFLSSERDAMLRSKKLRRGLQYVKSGYVRGVQDCQPNQYNLYKGHVKASMDSRAYWVHIAISPISGSIFKCTCDNTCPQKALGRCSHISALLLFLLAHIKVNGYGGKCACFLFQLFTVPSHSVQIFGVCRTWETPWNILNSCTYTIFKHKFVEIL
jgi:hypothetical protein